MDNYYEVVGVNRALVIEKLTNSIINLESNGLYSEDVQELLNSYVIQLQKELNAYINTYEKNL